MARSASPLTKKATATQELPNTTQGQISRGTTTRRLGVRRLSTGLWLPSASLALAPRLPGLGKTGEHRLTSQCPAVSRCCGVSNQQAGRSMLAFFFAKTSSSFTCSGAISLNRCENTFTPKHVFSPIGGQVKALRIQMACYPTSSLFQVPTAPPNQHKTL